MLSLAQLLLLVVVILLLFGPTRLPQLGRSLGEGFRNFKKSLHGEDDIDVTESVKHLKDGDDVR